MSKFKVGDKVTPTDPEQSGCGNVENAFSDKGAAYLEITGSESGDYEYTIHKADGTRVGNCFGCISEDDNNLVHYGHEENKPMARRTFKQLKDDATVKKGALWQEDCEDGTQPYTMITPDYFKSEDESNYSIDSRTLVEDQPEWFVEVFKVEPEYMTREELDAYKAFLKGHKPAKKQKATKKVSRQKAMWTPERRKAASLRMKKIRATQLRG